jgi:glutamate-1-semialdehyde 2,1-aminomutase
VGTMFTVFFSGQEVTTWETARLADVSRYACFFNAMLEGGVSLAPSQFEAAFVSTAHQEMEINITLAAARKAFQKVAEMTF